MSTMAGVSPLAIAGALLRAVWERVSVYLPIILMGLMAMGTYWLARNSPVLGPAEAPRAVTHVPDYFMRGFSVKTFDAAGRLKSEVYGTEGRHYPDTDTLEIDQPRIRSFNARREATVATARLALSNADGSEVQLIGDAIVTHEATVGADGHARPRLQFRGEFLQAFLNTERVKSSKPVDLTCGTDHFTADSLDYDNLSQVMELHGRVRGVLVPGRGR
jgi:lipopolysaccharide export system protein LptC